MEEHQEPVESSSSEPVVITQENQINEVKKQGPNKIVIGALLVVLIAAGSAMFMYIHKKKPVTVSNVTPVITYYYNDGKTVMWQDKDPAKSLAISQAPVAPHFLNAVYLELEQKYGGGFYKQGAWDVVTTLDKNLQTSAEKYVLAQEPSLLKHTANAAGFVGEDVVTGKIVSLVGNLPSQLTQPHDYANYMIEPGSSIKPFVYATLFDQTTNYGAGSNIEDTQGPLEGYPCTVSTPLSASNCLYNYDRQYYGNLPIRYSLAYSRNIPAVKAASIVGIKKIAETVKKLGATKGYNCYPGGVQASKPIDCFSAAAIGDGAYINFSEEVNAYASLSRNGVYIPSVMTDKVSLNGKVKSEWSAPKGEQVIKADAAYIVSDILSDPNAGFLSKGFKPSFMSGNFKTSIMTGVTNDLNTFSSFAYTTQYVAGFWFGKPGNAGYTYEADTIPVISGWLSDAEAGKTAVERVMPAGLQTLPAQVADPSAPGILPRPTTDIYPSYYKP
ncbi:MAG: hypothetical protein JWO47_557 [Candidatus Saccharibacteria bacterium]|nr:hypothetical protein [Candidatus Saccharibacteria bacterium]